MLYILPAAAIAIFSDLGSRVGAMGSNTVVPTPSCGCRLDSVQEMGSRVVRFSAYPPRTRLVGHPVILGRPVPALGDNQYSFPSLRLRSEQRWCCGAE